MGANTCTWRGHRRGRAKRSRRLRGAGARAGALSLRKRYGGARSASCRAPRSSCRRAVRSPSTAGRSAAGPEARAGARSSAVALGPLGGPSAMRPEALHLLRGGGSTSSNWGSAGNGDLLPTGQGGGLRRERTPLSPSVRSASIQAEVSMSITPDSSGHGA